MDIISYRGNNSYLLLLKYNLLLLSAHKNFVIRDKKYQTLLIFGLSVTKDKNTIKVSRTPGKSNLSQIQTSASCNFASMRQALVLILMASSLLLLYLLDICHSSHDSTFTLYLLRREPESVC